ARTRTPRREDRGEALAHGGSVGVRAADHQALRAPRQHLFELADAPRGQPPGVAELVEAQQPLNQHQRVLGDQIAVLLIGLLEQHGLDAPGAVIECQDPARKRPLASPATGRSLTRSPMRWDTKRTRLDSKRASG